MKKVFITILALIYLVTSTGAAINIHYCMGKVVSVGLLHNNDGECGKCGMKAKGGCCKDENKIIKIKDSHKLVSVYPNIIEPVAIINKTTHLFPLFFINEVLFVTSDNNSPPGGSSRSLCILNCVFII